MNARRRGFTLIEVLIALAIVATTLGSAVMVVHGAANNRDYLDRRRAAAWVADNVLNAYRLEPQRFEVEARTGRASGSETVLGRVFSYELSVKRDSVANDDDADARQPGLREVEVSVSDGDTGVALATRRRTLRLPEQSL